MYEAVQACQEIDTEAHRNRNLALLIEEVPWYCQPTLALVMKLLRIVSRPEMTQHNGLNIVAVAVFATPFLLRPRSIPRLNGGNMTPDDIDRAHMTAAAAGSAIVSTLVENMPDAFELLLRSQQSRVAMLSYKCDRLHMIQWEAIRPIVLEACGSDGTARRREEEVTEKTTGDDLDDEAVLTKIFGTECLYSDFTERREEMIYNMLALLWQELRRTHHHLTRGGTALCEEYTEENSLDLDDVELEGVSLPSHASATVSNLTSKPELRRAPSFSDSHLYAYYSPAVQASSTTTLSLLPSDDGSLPASPARLQRLAKSVRWAICFPHENPFKGFNTQLTGLLAVRCLTYFLKKFGDKASLILCEFANKRSRLAPLPMVCCYLVQICLVSLKLVHPHSFSYSAAYERNRRAAGGFPTEEGDGGCPLREVARERTWKILSDDTCLEELFCVSIMTFDDLWKHLLPSSPPSSGGATAGSRVPESPGRNKANSALAKEVLASCMTGCRVLMDELLSIKSVVSVEQLWRAWSEQRLQVW